MTDADFIEVIVAWGPGGAAPGVAEWLRERGMHPTPMRAGLLVTGDRQSFRRAFGVDATAGPQSVPIPPAIEHQVASISVPRPRQIQQDGDASTW